MMSRSTMPDLGEAILRVYADVPAEEAAKLLNQMTRNSVPTARINRFFVDEAERLKKLEDEFSEMVGQDPVPADAGSIVVSVDALADDDEPGSLAPAHLVAHALLVVLEREIM